MIERRGRDAPQSCTALPSVGQRQQGRAEEDNLVGLRRDSNHGRDIPCHGSAFRASFVSIREGRVIRHITSARSQATWPFQDALVDRRKSVRSRRDRLDKADAVVEADVEGFRGGEVEEGGATVPGVSQ